MKNIEHGVREEAEALSFPLFIKRQEDKNV